MMASPTLWFQSFEERDDNNFCIVFSFFLILFFYFHNNFEIKIVDDVTKDHNLDRGEDKGIRQRIHVR